jgi:hypothetical protein
MSVDLIYSSRNLKKLTNITKYITSHIKLNTDTVDKNQYLKSIILAVHHKYHQIPDNIGLIETQKHSQTQCCWICGNNISNTSVSRTLPCQHRFHKRCIDTWLVHNKFECANCQNCIRMVS